METTKIKLFTSPTCPNCPMAKNFIEKMSKERKDFKYEILETHTSEGMKQARKLEIRSVPTFIIKGPGSEQNIGFIGTPTTKRMNQLLDMSYGKEVEKKKRFGLF